MTDQEFEALVARLDQQAQRNPAAYRLRVILLGYVGYAYVAFVLVIAAGLIIGSLATLPYLKVFAINLALIFGGFFWVVTSTMWVRVAPPQGRRITRCEAPALFDLIDRLRRSLHAPKFHDVLIAADFNAAVVQVPKLGLLGWYRNTLLIGLPLMKALTREQLAAVLAHELGHLAGGHGRLDNWVYRLRVGWSRLADVLQQRQSAGSFAFRPFFQWYAPYFNAVSFPLARANEYDADAASARVTSPAAAAAALTNVNVIGRFLEARFWPDLHRKADEAPLPSFTPYAQMGGVIAAGVDATAASGWLDAAMARETSVADTHPALADRLRALREPPRLALPSPGEAADSLLGDEVLQSVTAAFDRRWREAVQPSWERRHQAAREQRGRLSALQARLANGDVLSLDERFERALLTGELHAGGDALDQFRALHAEAPGDSAICCAFGTRLLAVGDEAGVALVEWAIDRNEQILLPGAEALRDYYLSCNRNEEARYWHERWAQQMQVLQAADVERAVVRLDDEFEPHRLGAQRIEALRARLCAIPGVRRAYLVRKRLAYCPDRPLLILGFTTKPWWRWRRADRASAIQEQIAATVPFPHETRILCVDWGNKRLVREWRSILGARVL